MTKTRQRVIKCSLIAILIIFAPGCSNQPKRRAIARPVEVAKVRVSVDGKVYINESIVAFDELKRELDRLKQIHGGVWFISDSPYGEAGRQNQIVKKAIIDAELPIRVR